MPDQLYETMNGVTVGDRVTITDAISAPNNGKEGVVIAIRDAVSAVARNPYVFQVDLGDGHFRALAYAVEVIGDIETLGDLLDDTQLARAAALHLATSSLPDDTLPEDLITAASWIADGRLTFTTELTDLDPPKDPTDVHRRYKPDYAARMTARDPDGDSLQYWRTSKGDVVFSVTDSGGKTSAYSRVESSDLRSLASYLTNLLDGEN